MDKYQFEAYWQARLAFLGAGNVRIRTERLNHNGFVGDPIGVYISQTMMPTWGVFGGKRYTLSYRISPVDLYFAAADYRFVCKAIAEDARKSWDEYKRQQR